MSRPTLSLAEIRMLRIMFNHQLKVCREFEETKKWIELMNYANLNKRYIKILLEKYTLNPNTDLMVLYGRVNHVYDCLHSGMFRDAGRAFSKLLKLLK